MSNASLRLVGSDLESCCRLQAYQPCCVNCFAARDAGTWLARSSTHTEVGHYDGITDCVNGRYFFNGKSTAMPDGHPLWTFPLWCRGAKRPLLGVGQPTLIAVCITSDLFYEERPTETINRVVWTVAISPHIGLLLTRRAERMAAYFLELERTRPPAALNRWRSHIWIGFSAEDQKWFDLRWAALRRLAGSGWTIFCSYSPILGPLRLPPDFLTLRDRGWVLCAGEKAPNADFRPMDVRWTRAVCDQCVEAGVPIFMRQMSGTKQPIPPDLHVREFPRVRFVEPRP